MRWVEEEDISVPIGEFEERFKEYESAKTEEIIKRLEEIGKREMSDEEWEECMKLQNELASRLKMVSQSMFEQWQGEFVKNVVEKINELMEKLESHRHEASKRYTGKAEF